MTNEEGAYIEGYMEGKRDGRSELAKELREYGKQYHYKRGERIVLFRFARKIEKETAKEATKTPCENARTSPPRRLRK